MAHRFARRCPDPAAGVDDDVVVRALQRAEHRGQRLTGQVEVGASGHGDHRDAVDHRQKLAQIAQHPLGGREPWPAPPRHPFGAEQQVDAAVEAGTITLPTAPAVEGETVLEGDFEPEVQPDPPAGTADLGTPSEGNEADPAFRAPRTDTVDATVAAAEAAEADATE